MKFGTAVEFFSQSLTMKRPSSRMWWYPNFLIIIFKMFIIIILILFIYLAALEWDL